ncbi:UDP-N-acetylenolpyruvoylglucosamine reductase [Luminiphilus syltensis NOR5-1B]|uniref:UDP-N-acetylenolpyruvoylglucosamine reductase n=2 Tax=Luminiphilus TaxID=1341118 RepID=B8KYJ8_9GAMM|nr:UDP-N-acetylenolpyruvoylglucosamine reductase [Luminiphilus syltensis NOR5-1B]
MDAFRWAADAGHSVVPIGEGSNVVCRPWVPGLVLAIQNHGISLLADNEHDVLIRVGAGENWHRLVHWSVTNGLYGLENLALIPGTVGAAPVQNIGAYGIEIAAMIECVHVYCRETQAPLALRPEDCQFGYRTSVFKSEAGAQYIITAVDFRLHRDAAVSVGYPALQHALKDQSATPEAVMNAVIGIRQQRLPDPATDPNVGSFFKNPVVSRAKALELLHVAPEMPQYPIDDDNTKLSAAWMIDQLQWRGRSHQGAAVSDRHALVLIGRGATDASAFLELADQIAGSVADEFGVNLVMEPRIIGTDRIH